MRMMIALLVFASVSMAETILFDQAPGTTGGARGPDSTAFGYNNLAAGQNFADLLVLTSDSTLTGMDVYVSSAAGQIPVIGDSVTVRIRAASAGPILFEFTDVVSTLDADGVGGYSDTIRAHADFTLPVALTAGSYYIGMSATNKRFGFGQIAIDSGTGAFLDGGISQYGGTTFVSSNSLGDQAFRVWGDGGTPVPEPGTYALFGLAALGYGIYRRRRNAS